MKKYFKTLKIDAELLDDLKLVKRVLGAKNMSETIRRTLNSAGYTERWLDVQETTLEGMGKE